MSVVFALLTSDPNLLECELHRLQGQVELSDKRRLNAVGVGTYSDDDVLLQRFSAGATYMPLTKLAVGRHSAALLYHARTLPLGMSLEENTQPFRYGRWMFCHNGELEQFSSIRPRLLSLLPDHLRRQVKGDTDSEVAFAFFLKVLRDAGRRDESGLSAALASQLLAKTVKLLEQASAEAGSSRTSALNLVATNGRVMAAARHGEQSLFFTLLEGASRCDRCQIDGSTPDSDPRVRAHRRRKTVAVASHLISNAGWFEVQNGRAIAVGRDLSVQHLPI